MTSQPNSTQSTTSQPTHPATLTSEPMANLLTPISYAIAGAILLAAIAAFLRTLFHIGKD